MKNKERGIVQVPRKALTQTDGPWNKISAILRDATDNYTTSHNGIIHEACPYIVDAAPASCITTLNVKRFRSQVSDYFALRLEPLPFFYGNLTKRSEAR